MVYSKKYFILIWYEMITEWGTTRSHKDTTCTGAITTAAIDELATVS
jgi:hypothetical protein